MNEFSLIDEYFKSIAHARTDVLLGIGDDAACVKVPEGMDLLISMDTLVESVHFLMDWDAYDIASRAVRVNISDMAAMAAMPCWATLALTMPVVDEKWLTRFAQGLADTLNQFQIALIGGDTTRGPMTITLTIHGLAPSGQAIKRSGAQVGDYIVVSGSLGAAALAVELLNTQPVDAHDQNVLMEKLLHPQPRIDLSQMLQQHATAAIDISDGLSADLNHILVASNVGACLDLEKIPVHPLVEKYHGSQATQFALNGGDDYELCFTVSNESYELLSHQGLNLYCIGRIEQEPGLRAMTPSGETVLLQAKGYSHF